MAKLKTFTAACRGGHTREIAYHPLVVIAGDTVHTLALHQDLPSGWAVSDPRSGWKVCAVRGAYKGMPVSSNRIPLREARPLAQAAVEALLERIGATKFNAVLASVLRAEDTHS